MALNQQNVRPTLRKLGRQLSKLAGRPSPENIHKFRTSSRRVEVLVEDLAHERKRNDKKLLKLLSRLRKMAGRVRDLDVEITALRSLKIQQEPMRKSQLMRTLADERGKREKKLVKALDKTAVAEVRKRLKRTAGSLEVPKNVNPLAVAIRKISQVQLDQSAVTDETLHHFRVAAKRARYVAELASPTPEGTRLVEQLRRMQDTAGDWHDWAQLAARAEKLFGGVQDSALVAALRNVTRAKFRQAVIALTETRTALATKKPVAVATPIRRTSRSGSAQQTAVA
jgi:CHAD domain-containing protein